MTSKHPVNLTDLLRQRTVEGDRNEYKAGWNPNTKLMKENGSPEFESDDGRTHLLMRLPVQPQAVCQAEVGAQSGAQSRAQSEQIMAALLKEPLSINELVTTLGLKSKTGSLKRAVSELLADEFIEYTIPGKPSSRLQKYRLTSKAAIDCQLRAEEDWLEKLEKQKHGLMHDLLTGKIAANPRSEKQEALA